MNYEPPIKLHERVYVVGHGYGVKVGSVQNRRRTGFYGPVLTRVRLDDGREIAVYREQVTRA